MKGSRLKELRDSKSMTQSQLAEVLGVSQQAVGKWERETASPNDEMLKKIAALFFTTTDYLLGYDDAPSYYTDPETAALAEQIKNNPGGRVLFNAGKDLKPESIKEVMKFIEYQKSKEEHNTD